MKKKGIKINLYIFITAVGMVILQVVISFAGLVNIPFFSRLENDFYNNIYNMTYYQKAHLERFLNDNIKKAESYRKILTSEIEKTTSPDKLSFADVSEIITGLYQKQMWNNSVEGVFFIVPEKKSGEYLCIFLRDGLPVINSMPEDIDTDFFIKPYEVFLRSEKPEPEMSGYLSLNSMLPVTYAIPLTNANNEIYGIFGIEISLDNTFEIMSHKSVFYPGSCFILGYDEGMGILSGRALYIGEGREQFLPDSGQYIKFNKDGNFPKNNMGYITNGENTQEKKAAAVSRINIYKNGSYFYNDRLIFFGAASLDYLSEEKSSFLKNIYFFIAVLFSASVFLALLLSKIVSKPIKRLSLESMEVDIDKDISYKDTGILEIDTISSAFEALKDKVVKTASRMSKTVSLLAMPIGSFEADYKSNTVYLTETMFEILEIPHEIGKGYKVSMQQWRENLREINFDEIVSNKQLNGIYEWTSTKKGVKKWLHIKLLNESEVILGMIVDVTDEMLQKQRLEFERNFDPLTRLLNRYAFHSRVNQFIGAAPEKTGIMVFGDLDNLKYINDSFGHEMGDKYIQRAADAMTLFREGQGVAARISGDEFAAYIHGFESKESALKKFYEIYDKFSKIKLVTPGNEVLGISISMGMAFFPYDASSSEELLKYSDFAMYEIKHTVKGGVMEFNYDLYIQNSYLLNKDDYLNMVINEKKVKFAYQPVIDAKTGQVFGYEALMRPQVKEIKYPVDILKLAREYSKLYEVEKLVFYEVLEWLDKNTGSVGRKKIFINSIPNQNLLDNDLTELKEMYGHLLCNIVLEITENEYGSQENIEKKIEFFKKSNSKVAIDDFGAGYSNELILLSINPDFIKIDINVIKNIDKDNDRKQLVQNTISYAKSHRILTIAEGVETREEMGTLIHLGIDYMQGFYFGQPLFEPEDINENIKKEISESFEKFYKENIKRKK